MKIKEIEERTGLTRANIRFYESKGLLCPTREGNNYRDYSEEDVELLRKIVLFRRLGISIEDIRKLFDGTLSLQEAVARAKFELQSQIQQMQGSLELCTVMQERAERMETLSVDRYDELICQREQEGKSFRDVMGDILEDYQKNYLEEGRGLFPIFLWYTIPIRGTFTKVALLLLYWLLNTLSKGIWGGLESMLALLGAFVAFSALYMLCRLLGMLFPRKNRPAKASVLLAVGMVLFLLFVAAAVGFLRISS